MPDYYEVSQVIKPNKKEKMEILLKGTWAEIKQQLAEMRGDLDTGEKAVNDTAAEIAKEFYENEKPMKVAPIRQSVEEGLPDSPPEIKNENPDLDASGAKWDAKIHTRTRSKDVDGDWKVKKTNGVPPIVGAGVPMDDIIEMTLDDFTNYAAKINQSGAGTYAEIQALLLSVSVVNVTQVPVEKLAELAELLKKRFKVDY